MSTKKIFRVGVIDDFFRNEENKIKSVSHNQDFLFRNIQIISNQLNFHVEKISSKYNGGSIDSQRILNDMNLENKSLNSWVSAYANKDILNTKLLDEIKNYDLIVGFGITPSLIYYLNKKQINFLDLELSPYRFMNSIFFSARTNSKSCQDELHLIEVKKSYLISEAQKLSEFYSGINIKNSLNAHNRENNAVFFNQTKNDASLIMDGLKYSPNSNTIFKYLSAEFKKFDNVFISMHPLQDNFDEMNYLIEKINNTVLINNLSYSHIFDNSINKFYSISSSLLNEVELFHPGKTKRLIAPDMFMSELLNDTYSKVNIDRKVLGLEFWKNIILSSNETYDKNFLGLSKESVGWTVKNYSDSVYKQHLIAKKGGHITPIDIVNSSSYGWHDPEESFVWGNKKISSINLKFEKKQSYKLKIYISKYRLGEKGQNIVIKYITNHEDKLNTIKIPRSKTNKHIILEVPANQTSKVFSINLISDHLDNAPNDNRKLGYKIYRIEII